LQLHDLGRRCIISRSPTNRPRGVNGARVTGAGNWIRCLSARHRATVPYHSLILTRCYSTNTTVLRYVTVAPLSDHCGNATVPCRSFVTEPDPVAWRCIGQLLRSRMRSRAAKSEKGSTLTRERAQPQQKQRHACLEDRDTGEITELPTVHSSLPVTVTSLRRASLWQRCMCLLLLLFRFPHCLSLSLHTAALKRRPVSAGTPPTTPHVRSRILRCFCSFPSLPFAHRPLLCLLAFLLDLVLGAGGQKAAAGITNALVKCFQYLISL
jgi:hypothetical protein